MSLKSTQHRVSKVKPLKTTQSSLEEVFKAGYAEGYARANDWGWGAYWALLRGKKETMPVKNTFVTEDFEEGQRYVIQYWPRTFDGYGRDYKRTPSPKIEEVILRNGILMGWCGDYRTSTTHVIRPEDIIKVLDI